MNFCGDVEIKRRKVSFCPVLGDIYSIILMKIAGETFCLQML